MTQQEGKHYLYRHIRLDKNEPFYIGIGTKTLRCQYERANSKASRSSIWKNIVKKTEYEIEILLESDDYEFIKQKEIEFIKMYGRIDKGTGTLSNLTNGGDGTLGRVVTEEVKERHRAGWNPKSNTNKKKVIDFVTKKVFDSMKEAAEYNNYSQPFFMNAMNGKCPNYTTLVLLENYTGKEKTDNLSEMQTRNRSIGGKKGSFTKSKRVINLETLVIWNSTQDAYKGENISRSGLKHHLRGLAKNQKYMFLAEYNKQL